jgi:two-component system cell cycle response regulator CtrA
MSATELQRLHDRIEELETLLGVDRSTTGRIRDAFGIEPRHVQIVGMLLARDFVQRDGLYTVLYGGLPEKDWPDDKILDAQICKLRPRLEPFGIEIKTKWGEGWFMSKADKAKVRDHPGRRGRACDGAATDRADVRDRRSANAALLSWRATHDHDDRFRDPWPASRFRTQRSACAAWFSVNSGPDRCALRRVKCAGSGKVIRGIHWQAVTPKLGEAGTDDCPRCDGSGFDLSAIREFEEVNA